MNFRLPSERHSRRQVEVEIKKVKQSIYDSLNWEQIFVIFDESQIKCKKYCNVLAGSIKRPIKIFCLNCIELDVNLNSLIVGEIIIKTLEIFDINVINVLKLISDA